VAASEGDAKRAARCLIFAVPPRPVTVMGVDLYLGRSSERPFSCRVDGCRDRDPASWGQPPGRGRADLVQFKRNFLPRRDNRNSIALGPLRGGAALSFCCNTNVVDADALDCAASPICTQPRSQPRGFFFRRRGATHGLSPPRPAVALHYMPHSEARTTIAGMARVKPFDYALYLLGESSGYLEDRADELSWNELESLREQLARIGNELQDLRAKRTAN
jgi:hypothetical protein